MIIYISGKITGDEKARERFAEAEAHLKNLGHVPINPFRVSDACPGLDYGQYIRIDLMLIETVDCLYMLKNWRDSPGATIEHDYARNYSKLIIEEE